MGRTLLLGDSRSGWRDWLKFHLGSRDHLVLDPADATHGTPARLTLQREGRTVAWRFYGSLDPMRAPHLLVAGAASLLQHAADDAVVQVFPLGATPLALQTAHALADLIAPARIVAQEGLAHRRGWPVGPEALPHEAGFPDLVRHAQRKAQWLKLLEDGEVHEVELASVAVQGVRLGTGTAIPRGELAAAGLKVLRGEQLGSTLMVVAAAEPDEASIARALDRFHCQRVVSVRTDAYDGLLCAFAREGGEPLGMGWIERVDFETGIVHARCTAVPPAPVRVLQIGALRIDADGNEHGEVRPWQV